jgi:hypothetical protein
VVGICISHPIIFSKINKIKLNRFCSPVEDSYVKEIKGYLKEEYLQIYH